MKNSARLVNQKRIIVPTILLMLTMSCGQINKKSERSHPNSEARLLNKTLSELKIDNSPGDTITCGSSGTLELNKCRKYGIFSAVEKVTGNVECNDPATYGFLRYNDQSGVSTIFTQGGCAGTFRLINSTPNPDIYTKFNPGHYVKFPETTQLGQIQSVLDNPSIKGIMLQVTWKQLNVSPGVYDSGIPRIRSFLQALEARQKHLILMMLDYSADSSCTVLPDYIKNNPGLSARTLSLPSNPNGGGCMAMLWKAPLLAIWKSIHEKLGQEFDANPYFEGMRTRESTYSVNKASTGYTDALLTQNLISLGNHAKTVFKHTNFFLSLSRISGTTNSTYLRQVIEGTKEAGVGIAWPDTIGQINDHDFDRIPIWALAKEYRNEVPIFAGGDTSGTQVPSSAADNATYVRKVFDLVTGNATYCHSPTSCTPGFKAPYFYWIKTVTGRHYPAPVTEYFNQAVAFLNERIANGESIIESQCPTGIAPCRSAP